MKKLLYNILTTTIDLYLAGCIILNTIILLGLALFGGTVSIHIRFEKLVELFTTVKQMFHS